MPFIAYEIDAYQFYYSCPDCKRGFHVHGNCKDWWTNRTESRSSHCSKKLLGSGDIEVVINDSTKRVRLTTQQLRKWKPDTF